MCPSGWCNQLVLSELCSHTIFPWAIGSALVAVTALALVTFSELSLKLLSCLCCIRVAAALMRLVLGAAGITLEHQVAQVLIADSSLEMLNMSTQDRTAILLCALGESSLLSKPQLAHRAMQLEQVC